MKIFMRGIFFLTAVLLVGATTPSVPERLSELAVSQAPWDTFEPNSEQMQPFAVGATPRDFVFDGKQERRPRLFSWMLPLAKSHAETLCEKLGVTSAVFELWPVYSEEGDTSWAWARWKPTLQEEWRWLDQALWHEDSANPPLLPVTLRTWVADDYSRLFDDYSGYRSLYAKPSFASGIWFDESGSRIRFAWPTHGDREKLRKLADSGKRSLVRILPPPARKENRSISFLLHKKGDRYEWNEDIQWDREVAQPKSSRSSLVHLGFPPTFTADFKKDVEILGDAREATVSAKHFRFFKRNSQEPDHELEQLAGYLSARHAEYGLVVRRHRFRWAGTMHSNLFAVIPGTLPPDKNLPILLSDHYDTAFCEDEFARTGKRVSSPGADDNATAIATLLAAARVLKDSRPKHDIWLSHFTAEEYPADSLGARRFFSEALGKRTRLGAMVLLDLIGYRRHGETVFQLNTGNTPESMQLAAIAMEAAKQAAPGFKAVLRPRFDRLSYLYNTDGWIADMLGFPVLYFNEHLHRDNMDANPHYHQCSDLPRHLDWNYAAAIAKTAILTTITYANQP